MEDPNSIFPLHLMSKVNNWENSYPVTVCSFPDVRGHVCFQDPQGLYSWDCYPSGNHPTFLKLFQEVRSAAVPRLKYTIWKNWLTGKRQPIRGSVLVHK